MGAVGPDVPLAASVVVCTHDRAGLLAGLTAALRRQVLERPFEVLIVDSASSDRTPQIAADLATDRAPRVRTVRSARDGLCTARNLGLREAAGGIVAFLDDDAVPHPGWLAAIVAAFSDARVGAAGGPVVLRYESPPPAWLTEPLARYLTAYDLGPAPRSVHYTLTMEQYPRGANIAVRRAAAIGVDGFRTMFERRGRRGLRSNDEADLCYRLESGGWQIRYAPRAVVDHIVSVDRLQPRWFLRRFAAQGLSDALFQLGNRGVRKALGRLRWYHAAQLLRLPARVTGGRRPERLLAECDRRAAWGYVRGLALGLAAGVRPPGARGGRPAGDIAAALAPPAPHARSGGAAPPGREDERTAPRPLS
jgi:glycosyltransferase involved in cell wall biosynthesis